MIKIDVYHAGASARVALHYHPYAADGRCGPECEHEARYRAYQPHKGTPRDYRQTVIAAVVEALSDPAVGHVAFASMVGDQLALELGL